MSEARLLLGDSFEELDKLPENSVAAVITDPPYGLVSIQKRFGKEDAAPARFGTDGAFTRISRGFMSCQWDGRGIEKNPEFWKKVYRVLKPGGFLLAFSGARTQHRQTCAIEDAGFNICDLLAFHHGSGFPKALDISAAIDKHLGHERKVVGTGTSGKGAAMHKMVGDSLYGGEYDITSPAGDEIRRRQGWKTQLKPAMEPICMAQKPLSEKTYAANVLKHGVGGLNIDASRIPTSDRWEATGHQSANEFALSGGVDGSLNVSLSSTHEQGRYPANLLLEHSCLCTPDECHPTDCPVAVMDRQSGPRKAGGKVKGHEPSRTEDNGIYGHFERVENTPYEDEGGASRFFKTFWPNPEAPFIYTPKPSGAEKSKGLECSDRHSPCGETERQNTHPTVKSVALMKYLCSLVCPPGGTVLDPFLGSGTTGVAAVQAGFGFIGIEREEEYMAIARARLKHAQGRTGLFADNDE